MLGFHNTPPFGIRDLSAHGSAYLGVQEIGRMMRVCKDWRDWANKELVVWKNASHHDKIPIVDGKGRNYRDDLQRIKPLVSSVHGLLGRVLGSVPTISQETFRKFTSDAPDRFGAGLFRANFVLLIDPAYIERRVGKDAPLALEGNSLIEVSADEVVEQTLVIEATFPNLLCLAKFPLKGKEHLPVYRIDKEVLKAMIVQSIDFPEKVGVRVMKQHVIEDSSNIDFAAQQALVQQMAPGEGYSAESARRRFLFDAERILTTGTCPDGQKPRWTYVRGPETVDVYGGNFHLVVGGFAPGAGVRVYSHCFVHDDIGVVPGGPAEVLRPLELGNLAIDNGH